MEMSSLTENGGAPGAKLFFFKQLKLWKVGKKKIISDQPSFMELS